jgi:hypothetical protein
MTVQYDRKLSFAIGTAAGDAVQFDQQFKVTFRVQRGDIQSPNSCDVRVYNLSDQTANTISTREFTQIALQAGYPGNFGLIFRGVIKQARIGRADAKDNYVDITAADGDEAYCFSSMSLTLAKGSTPQDSLQAIFQDMARAATNQPITMGYQPQLATNGRIRGRTFYGMTRDELEDFAAANEVTWSIQDGQLTLIPKRSYIPGTPVLIGPQTGLIGVPEQTQNGIEARVLLNPQVKIGQLVKLDSKVNLLRKGVDLGSFLSNKNIERSLKTNSDGLYYVLSANHWGDTRGQPWYTDLIMLAVDGQVPMNLAPKAAIQPDAVSIRLD